MTNRYFLPIYYIIIVYKSHIYLIYFKFISLEILQNSQRKILLPEFN